MGSVGKHLQGIEEWQVMISVSCLFCLCIIYDVSPFSSFMCVCVYAFVRMFVCVCLSVQRKKIETRTLDAVITRLNAEGQKVSVTSKCADFDREVSECIFMCVFMGVFFFMITNTETGQLTCIFM